MIIWLNHGVVPRPTPAGSSFMFFLCTIVRRLLRGLPRNNGCQEPLIFPISLGGAFGKGIVGSNTLSIWDRS